MNQQIDLMQKGLLPSVEWTDDLLCENESKDSLSLNQDPLIDGEILDLPAVAEDEVEEVFEAGDEDLSGASALAILFKDIRNIPFLTAAQEIELSKMWMAQERKLESRIKRELKLKKYKSLSLGKEAEVRRQLRKLYMQDIDVSARNTLVDHNILLAIGIASKPRFQGRGLSLNDLVQASFEGLIRAAEMFDYRKGCRFTTYATHWIKQSILRELKQNGRTIRIPMHQYENAARVNKTRAKLAHQLGHLPTEFEVASEAGMSEKMLSDSIEAHRVGVADISVFSPPPSYSGSDDDDLNLIETAFSDRVTVSGEGLCLIRDAYKASLEEFRAMFRILRAVVKRTPRNAQLFLKRFGLDNENFEEKTLKDIGRDYKITRERVRQIETKILMKFGERRLKLTDAEELRQRGEELTDADKLRMEIKRLLFAAQQLGITDKEVFQDLHKGLTRD